MMNEEEYSVEVTDVHKKYFNFKNSEQLLRGLSLKVRKGSICGLLGPSGCGKTTLLKCILGKLNIDNGTIKLCIKNWNQVGYMPQNVSLHDEFTIEELFKFYGTIYELDQITLEARIKELVDLLDLPPIHKSVAHCSGGEQRRVSLAITLLHDPEILLLDEPTVGLDPLLSYKITIYLKELAEKCGKTIIITTHYMEEARSLNTVAFMRNGMILYEGSPDSIISSYNCSSLDDAFVQLINNNKPDIDNKGNKRVTIRESIKIIPCLKNNSIFNWNHLNAQVYKNYKWTLRNIPTTLVVFAIPFLCVLLFNSLFSKFDPNIGYYNEEVTNRSFQCSDNAIYVDDCPPSPYYSCQYLRILGQKRNLREYGSIKEGLDSIKRGESYGFIYFPKNFSISIASRLSFRINEIHQGYYDQQLHVYMDNTLYVEATNTHTDLYESLLNLVEMKCDECGIDKRLAKAFMLMKRMPAVYGENMEHFTRTYPYMIISNMVLVCYIYTASMISLEKVAGTLERVEIAGMTTGEILGGNFVAQFLMMNLQNMATLVVTYGVLNEPCHGSYVLVYIIITLNGILGSLTGLLVTSFTKHAYSIGYIGTGMMLSITTINGSIWPTEGMHWLIKSSSDYNPVVMSSNSYAHIAFRGYILSHPLVYQGIIYVTLSCIWTIILIYMKIRLSKKL